MTITNHWGKWVDSESPITGVHSIHDMSWECLDWDEEICLDCESAFKEIEEHNTACPECGESSYPEANGTEDQDNYNRICNGCGISFQVDNDDWVDDDMIECDSSHTKLLGSWIKNDDGKYEPDLLGEYAAIENETTIQVVWSNYMERHGLCSPCYPGQADVDSKGEFLCFVLPPELRHQS